MKIAKRKPLETPEQRAARHAELKAAIIAYKNRWEHAPVQKWDDYLNWCDRQKATAAKFNASSPGTDKP